MYFKETEMPVQKFRKSAQKRDQRRSHHALKAKGISLCPNCGESKLPHMVCAACGHYKGKQVLEPKKTTDWQGDDFKVES